ncbi:MAG: HNH endonuclease [Planctomycetes bacterium]|nr:HNH endonuclease [Planctomycetota bacterium]
MRRAGLVKPTTYLKHFGRHEHRVVMEQHIGRPLGSLEIVHHIDGNKHNNAIENLVITTQAEHAREHSTKNRKCSLPGCDRKHVAHGLCGHHYDKKRRA